MEEDDLDFTPTQSTSSNLASLFGFNKKSMQGNSSLTYTAPKAPKKESSPMRSQPVEAKSSKSVIICSKAVQAYKLENRNYVSQGLAGIVISGNHDSSIYAIILYNQAKEHISNVTITKTFMLTLSANNYVSFYDNHKQNWSIMFRSSGDVEQFVEKVATSKFYCHPGPSENLLIQDLSPSSNTQSSSSSIVEITYNSFSLDKDSINAINENKKERIDLSDSSVLLAKALMGCSENTTRLIIVPHSQSGPWSSELGSGKNLLLKVKIEKIISQVEDSLMNAKSIGDSLESPIDSSTEETSVKARTASIKEVIANTKSQKANLISRMARMGQATLPLKQGISGGPSDSEEDCTIISSPKPRMPRSRSGTNAHQNSSTNISQNFAPEAAKQLSVYQSDLNMQQMQLAKFGMPHQVIPVSASPALSPTSDPSFSVYVSESRIQATELRMSISKISDKVDAVLNKVQTLNFLNSEPKSNLTVVQEPNSILTGVQNLIMENERLKADVQEQKKKLEQQNDRIFQLLDMNHKYLEQNSTSLGKQSDIEVKLRKEINECLEKESQSKEECKKHQETIKRLEGELERIQDEMKRVKKAKEDIQQELENSKKLIEGNNSMKTAIESHEVKLAKASEIVAKLKEKLKESMAENERLKSAMETQKESIKTKANEHEKTVRKLETRISEDDSKHKTVVHDYENAVKSLEEEKEKLISELRKEKEAKENNLKKVKNQIYENLMKSFPGPNDYSTSVILSIIKKQFGVCEVEPNDQTEIANVNAEVKPVAEVGSSVENIEVRKQGSHENVEEEKIPEKSDSDLKSLVDAGKKDGEDDTKNDRFKGKKDENYGGNKSYDQRWRTTKPPPPPLFDEEDDDDWLN